MNVAGATCRITFTALRMFRKRPSHCPLVKPELSSGKVARKSVMFLGSELV